jgi:hypothetical protein
MFDHSLSCVIVDADVGMAVVHIQTRAHLNGVDLLHEAPRTWVFRIGLDCT